MAAISREERRKRKLDRRSHRLALISGRIQSLPSSLVSSPHHHLAVTTHLSTKSLVFTRDHHDHLQSLLSNQNSAGTEGPVTPSGPHRLQKYSSLLVPREKPYDVGRQVESQVPKYETKIVNEVAVADASAKSQRKPEPVLAAPIVEKPLNDTELQSKPSRIELYLFSCKQINSCIITSQGTQFLCPHDSTSGRF